MRIKPIAIHLKLTFPIHPALSVSLGRASLNFVTKHTFKRVANPCPDRISMNSAFNTGTLLNRDEAFDGQWSMINNVMTWQSPCITLIFLVG